MVRKIAGKGSRKAGNCLFLEKRTIQPKIPEEIQIERKFPARIEISEISEYLVRFSSFSRNPENAVPFVTRNFRKSRPEFFS